MSWPIKLPFHFYSSATSCRGPQIRTLSGKSQLLTEIRVFASSNLLFLAMELVAYSYRHQLAITNHYWKVVTVTKVTEVQHAWPQRGKKMATDIAVVRLVLLTSVDPKDKTTALRKIEKLTQKPVLLHPLGHFRATTWLQHSQHVTCCATGPHSARSSICLRLISWRCTAALPHGALPALLSSSANSQRSSGWWGVQSRRHSTVLHWRHPDNALLPTQLRTDFAILSLFFSLTKYSNNCFGKNEGRSLHVKINK